MIRKVIGILLVLLLTTSCVKELSYLDYYSSGDEGTESFIELIKLKEDVWIHRTYMTFGKVLYPANGLILLTKDEMLMIDTPWNDEQTGGLLQLSDSIFGPLDITCIITHAHDDTMGGIYTLLEYGASVFSTQMTYDFAKTINRSLPEVKLESTRTLLTINNVDISTYYPGGGHTEDNIVVYLNDYDILFAGCLVKDMDSDQIANIADANVLEWVKSLHNVANEFPDAEVLVPGHGEAAGFEILAHTVEVVENYLSESN